jgi:hypothetical protein
MPPELVIPVRVDVKGIAAQLGQVAAAGKKAGDQTAQGFAKAKGASEGLGTSLLGLMKAQIGLAAIRQTAQAVASDFKESNEYVMRTAKEFQNLRKTMQEVATLRGVANTNKFTLSEAQAAQASGLTPAERRDAQSAFLNFAGAQIGDEQGKKLNTAQADDFSSRIAVMMKSAGYSPQAGMNLGGAMLQQKTGPQNVDALMKEFGVAFQVMEKGQVPIERAAPELAELMAMGMSAKEAALSFSVASPAAPGQEGAAVQGAFRAIEEMKVEGKEGLFGVTNKMTPYESVKAFGANLADKRAANLAAGMNDEEAKTQLAKELAQAGVAGDIRQRRGLIAGFGRMGAELGGFNLFEDVARDTPADFEAQRRARYEGSSAGQQARIEAAAEVADAEAGERGDALKKVRDRAEIELTKAGRFEAPPMLDRMRATVPTGGLWSDDRKSMQINSQAIQGMRARLGEGSNALDPIVAANTNQTNILLRQLIDRVAALPPAPPPLTAPPRPADGARNNN